MFVEKVVRDDHVALGGGSSGCDGREQLEKICDGLDIPRMRITTYPHQITISIPRGVNLGVIPFIGIMSVGLRVA
jgi:hypothetical protein